MILIYSDPHLGLNLAANTTPASRAALQRRLEEKVDEVLTLGAENSALNICAGDFFHSYSNPETVILRAMRLASRTHFILSGNHDVVNIADKRGSLDVIDDALGGEHCEVVKTYFDKLNYTIHCAPEEGWAITLVPHHTTQQQFEEALLMAAKEQAKMHASTACKRVLITHCNYDLTFETGDNTLNLSRPLADHLLNKGAYFDYIFLGHEHNPREDFDGRLVVLGNPHPTGFGDISDKRVALLFEDGTIEFVRVWDKSKGYFECGPEALESVPASTEFLRVKGEVDPPALHAYAKAVRKLWQASPKLFAVRSEVVVKTGNKQATLGKSEVVNIKDLITEELRDNEALFALWQEISA